MDDGKNMLNNLFFNLGLIKDHNSVSIGKSELDGGIFVAAYPTHKSGMFCVGDGNNVLSFNGTHIAGLRNVMRSLEKNKVHHTIVEHHIFLNERGQFICMKRLGDKSRFRKVLVSKVDMEGEVVSFFGEDNLARCLYAEARINKDAVINSERPFYEHGQLIDPATEFKEVVIEKDTCQLTLPNYLEQPLKIKSGHQKDIQFYGRMIAGIKIKGFDYDAEECVYTYKLIFFLSSGKFVCFTMTKGNGGNLYEDNYRIVNDANEVMSFFGASDENNHLYLQANISLTETIS